MDNDDSNPFADSTARKPTASTFPNQPKNNDSNPFTSATTPAEPAPPPQQPSVAAYLTPSQPATYQPSAYTPVPAPVTVQRPTDEYAYETKPKSTDIDVSHFERRQAELEAREKRIAERERALANPDGSASRVNNFPPIPKIGPCGPCFYQDISVEIPGEFQRVVRLIFYLWIFYSVALFLNMIAALSYFLIGSTGGIATFGLSLVYLVLFVPASYVCWFRAIYRAFNGFILMIKLFAAGGSKIGVGLIVMIVTFSFAILALADGLILIKVHRLYRQSGASLELAQKEFQTAFVNNATVRGAAREVATAGINEALRSDGNQGAIY